MKLKPSLTLDAASAILDSALACSRAENMLPMTVVILDAGGKMIASKSEDGSGIMRFDIARGKAWGALGMGVSSRLIRDRLSARPTFVTSLAAVADGRFVPVPGGVLIEDVEGFTIGAIGISGDTSEKFAPLNHLNDEWVEPINAAFHNIAFVNGANPSRCA